MRTEEWISPASIVIKAFGGVGKTAKAVGRTPSVVSKWQKTGIPSAIMPVILKVAKELGLRITANDLIEGRRATK